MIKSLIELIYTSVGCIIAVPLVTLLLSIGLVIAGFCIGALSWIFDIAFFWL